MTVTFWDTTLYLFGGYSSTGPLNDLWMLDLATFTFKELFINSDNGLLTPDWPSPIVAAQMYLSSTDKILLFYGGYVYNSTTSSYTVSNQLWEYWLAFNNWFLVPNDHFYTGSLT